MVYFLFGKFRAQCVSIVKLVDVVNPLPLDARLDRVLRERSSSDKVRADKLASTLTTSLTGAVKNKLDHLVKSEMKSIILPCELV